LTGRVGSPQWGLVFQLRDWARVHTIQGDTLNVREYPTLNARVLTALYSGSRVGIMGGPRDADGYRWWRVRTETGVEGWAVESILDDRGESMRTLQPTD
ncbi:MAG: SH3 domain-containing protein, partial [Anaerolineae bacterium]|nr:SH3 domain-containing protein [Anaerolineae bacterium]